MGKIAEITAAAEICHTVPTAYSMYVKRVSHDDNFVTVYFETITDEQ